MRSREFKKLMRQVRKECQPDENWVNNTRDLLMAKINQDLPAQPPVKIPFWLNLADALVPKNLASHPVAVFSLVLGLFLMTSFASVNASKNTLPGDVLYPVKITAENIKYNLTFSDENKAKAAMSMVENRVSEVKKIVKEENGQRQEKVAQVTQKIKSGLKIVKDKVQVINEKSDNESDNEKVVATVKEIDGKLTVVKNEITEVAQGVENEVGGELAQVVDEVEKTSAVVLAVLGDKENTLRPAPAGSGQAETQELDKGEVQGLTEEIGEGVATFPLGTSTSAQEVEGVTKGQIFNTTSEVILSELIIEEEVEAVEEFGVKIGE